MKKLVILLFGMILVTGQVFSQDSVTIKIVTGEGDYFGAWHHKNDSGELEGYDIDVGNAACELAGLKCKFYTQKFDTIIQSVRFNKYDIVMSGLTNNKNRRRIIDFVDSYAAGGTDIITNDATESGREFCRSCPENINVENEAHYKQFTSEIEKHFNGKTIAVQRGTKSNDFFINEEELTKKINLLLVDTRKDVLTAVASNKADMGFGPGLDLVVDYNTEKKSKLRVYDIGLSGGDFGRGVGMAIRKEDSELKQKLSEAILQLRKEGKLKELAIKWFGEDVSPK